MGAPSPGVGVRGRSAVSGDVESFCISPDHTLRDAMGCIDRNAEGIALVVDAERRLLDTISDGDTRRAIRVIRQIPLVDDKGRVVGLALLGDLVRSYELPLTAVVMAGGFGTRLSPLTDDVPKPMLRVGDTPMLERIVEQLREAGVRRVNVATHYRGDLIADHFKDGSDFGVELEYVHEDQPLGTAGALGRMEHAKEPLLVINGDILTHVDFRAMLHFHREHAADMTVAVRENMVSVPYGIVEIEDEQIVKISEKPTLRYLVNAGIYLLDPDVVARVPRDRPSDMTHLIEALLSDGARVVAFPIHEYWIDIGRIEDYERALADFEQLRSEHG
jgi:NDP-sugar pyrophosphorylase family protein